MKNRSDIRSKGHELGWFTSPRRCPFLSFRNDSVIKMQILWMMAVFSMASSACWNQNKDKQLKSKVERWKAFKDKVRENTAGQTIFSNGSKKMKCCTLSSGQKSKAVCLARKEKFEAKATKSQRICVTFSLLTFKSWL